MVISLLMVVQVPVMAEELVPEDEALITEEAAQEELSADEDLLIDETAPEELITEEDLEEDDLIPEDFLEEGLENETPEEFTEESDALQEEAGPVDEESLLEEDGPALVGALSGQCGDNVYYTLSDEGVLTISGTGDMWGWEYSNTPWWNEKYDILEAVIERKRLILGAYF